MDYEIVYSDRKSISLCVKDGKLIVRSPRGVPKSVIAGIVRDRSEWINNAILKQKEKNKKFDSLTSDDERILRKNARKVLTAKTEYYAKIMGLNYGRITITGAKTRFGSCSSKGNISYSYRLMMYPDEAIDYVVVHELAHLREMNHSKKFYAIIESVLPDYRQRQKMLKK